VRLLGIDYGEKRIGIALSDPLKMFVKPFCTLSNTGENDLINEINKIIKSQVVERIILGLPLNLQGEDTIKTKEIRVFYDFLVQNISIPVELWDERYSTADANEYLKQKGYNWKESRKVVDQVAAAVILRSYIDSK
jgi:putative Holliday junction resolvase